MLAMLNDMAAWLGFLGASCALIAGSTLLAFIFAHAACDIWERLNAWSGTDES